MRKVKGGRKLTQVAACIYTCNKVLIRDCTEILHNFGSRYFSGISANIGNFGRPRNFGRFGRFSGIEVNLAQCSM